MIDLRSDTVTKPTKAMWDAMANAQVGDDVYFEDPTVNNLQNLAAEMLGKEAGLFVPSGTMGNLASILAHCGRGDEVIMGDQSHTFHYEAGGIAALGGVHPRTLKNNGDGTIDVELIRASIRPDDAHHPVTRLISLENTHNRCGGSVLPLDYIQEVSAIAKDKGLLMHLDGARLFNAAAALDVAPKEITKYFDSVTICLSKSLCAPVGSVICGSEDFIFKAHRIRKQLGGGMRQAGVVAAAGIVGLEEMVGRLKEDHVRAALLATELEKFSYVVLDKGVPQTNMVYVSFPDEFEMSMSEIKKVLEDNKILVGQVGKRGLRLVVHYWISDEDIGEVIKAFSKLSYA